MKISRNYRYKKGWRWGSCEADRWFLSRADCLNMHSGKRSPSKIITRWIFPVELITRQQAQGTSKKKPQKTLLVNTRTKKEELNCFSGEALAVQSTSGAKRGGLTQYEDGLQSPPRLELRLRKDQQDLHEAAAKTQRDKELSLIIIQQLKAKNSVLTKTQEWKKRDNGPGTGFADRNFLWKRHN